MASLSQTPLVVYAQTILVRLVILFLAWLSKALTLTGSQQSTEPSGKQVQAPLDEPADSQTLERVLDRTDECIRIEATKMQIKHSSLVNTATDVVFRSDYMTFCDTRVSMCDTICCGLA